MATDQQKAIRKMDLTSDGHVRSSEPGWMAVSFSSIWKYRECPRQYRESILAGLDVSGDAADRGTELHSVAESVQNAVEHVESGTLPLTGVDKYFELKAKLLSAGQTEGAKTEQELFVEWEIAPGLRAQLRAFVDWLVIDEAAGAFEFEDYKTGRLQKYDEHEYQRFIYALTVMRNYLDLWKGTGMTTYLQWQEPHRGKRQEFTAGGVEEFAVALEAQVRAMSEDTEFRAKPGTKRCGMCDFRLKCDAAQKLLSPFELTLPVTTKVVKKKGATVLSESTSKGDFTISAPQGIASPEDLQAMGRALFQLDAVRTAIVAALKEGVDRYGPVELADEGVSFAPWIATSRTVKDIDALLATAAELGIPYGDLVRFNPQQGKRHLEDNPSLAKLAEPYTERYPKWEFRKTKSEDEETGATAAEGAVSGADGEAA